MVYRKPQWNTFVQTLQKCVSTSADERQIVQKYHRLAFNDYTSDSRLNVAKRGHGFDTEKYVGKKTRYKIFKTTRSAFQPPNKSLYVPLEANTAISKTNLNNGENDSADFARLFLSSV